MVSLIIMRYSQDIRSYLRRIAVLGFPVIASLSLNKTQILAELKELLDDEEPFVKIEAFNILADVFQNCDK